MANHASPLSGSSDVTRQTVHNAGQALALDALADHLRRAHLKTHGITQIIPWSALNTPERNMRLKRAQERRTA